MTAPPVRTSVLCDDAADRRLADDGYAVVPFLDPAEVTSLRNRYAEMAPGDDRGLTIDFSRPDRSMLREVAGLLAPIWNRHLARVFVDHRPVVATFIVKHPGPGSDMVLHNEPTYVDGDTATHNIWIPLIDVQAEPPNGTLELVLGTQHLPFGLTGFNTPPIFLPYEHFLRAHTISLDVPAGSGVIYDSRMLHVSGPNTTDRARPAIAAAVAPRDAGLVHVIATGRRTRRLYAVDEGFFLDAHPTEAEDWLAGRAELVREVQQAPALTPAEVQAAVGGSDRPPRDVVVPPDLTTGDATLPLPWLTTADLPVEVSAVDVPQGAAGVAPSPVPGLGVLATQGSAALVPWAERAAAGVPAGLVEHLDRAWSDGADAVAVLDPHVRVELATEGAWNVVAYECPVVRSGVRTADRAAHFDLGRQVTLPEDAAVVTLWNDGPGPLWAVFTRPPIGQGAQPAATRRRWMRWRRSSG